jgi:hypothetical protein
MREISRSSVSPAATTILLQAPRFAIPLKASLTANNVKSRGTSQVCHSRVWAGHGRFSKSGFFWEDNTGYLPPSRPPLFLIPQDSCYSK